MEDEEKAAQGREMTSLRTKDKDWNSDSKFHVPNGQDLKQNSNNNNNKKLRLS